MGECVIALMLHFASSSYVRYYCSLDNFMNVSTTDGYLQSNRSAIGGRTQ